MLCSCIILFTFSIFYFFLSCDCRCNLSIFLFNYINCIYLKLSFSVFLFFHYYYNFHNEKWTCIFTPLSFFYDLNYSMIIEFHHFLKAPVVYIVLSLFKSKFKYCHNQPPPPPFPSSKKKTEKMYITISTSSGIIRFMSTYFLLFIRGGRALGQLLECSLTFVSTPPSSQKEIQAPKFFFAYALP